MSNRKQYDAIVIGSGQGGGPLSTALAKAGRKSALIEHKKVGGTCVNYGCTPTKTMAASARVAHVVGRAGDYGVEVDSKRINMKEVRKRKRDIVESFRSGSQKSIEEVDGVDLLMGEAAFVGSKQLEIKMNNGDRKKLAADWVFINTGSRPAVPRMPGLESVPYLDSTSIMELEEIPEHLLIIGGGYIGIEFGQMFLRFGSRVTLMHRGTQLVAGEDSDVAEEIAEILQTEGMTIEFEAEARRVEKGNSGQINLVANGKSGEKKISGSHLLIAAGRVPNTEHLNLGAAEVNLDEHGFVHVNERLETNVQGIYALGDVKGGPAFTHISYDDYRLLSSNLLQDGDRLTSDRLVPYTIFIDPQLGRVGLTEKEALEKGLDIQVTKLPMNRVSRALEVDETSGFMKVIIDTNSKKILGCAILGMQGGEIASILQVAMMGNVTYPELRDGIFAHPTLAESLNSIFANLQ